MQKPTFTRLQMHALPNCAFSRKLCLNFHLTNTRELAELADMTQHNFSIPLTSSKQTPFDQYEKSLYIS